MKSHWQQVYSSKPADAVSWYQPQATMSLAMIAEAGLPCTAPIIDVGGGASTLVDGLLDAGHGELTVLDLSAAALQAARQRLGARAASVQWIEGDVTRVALPGAAYALWHDRAVFHFLTEADDRALYLAQLRRALAADGQVLMATFAPDGPTRCSGLPVRQYSAASLATELGETFDLVDERRDAHVTPDGQVQRFQYCRFRRRG